MRYLLALGIAILSLTSCSISTELRKTPHAPFAISADEDRTPLFVFSHRHHTGLVLPREALKNELPELNSAFTGDWLEFGWGDEGFYRSEEVTLPLAFRALAYPTPGVMHVASSSRPLHFDYAYSPAHLIHLTDQQKNILVKRIARQFSRDKQGRLQPLGPGRYGESRFYRARQRFYFPKTCNAWTSQHLRAIGYRVRAITAPGVFQDLGKLPEFTASPHPSRSHAADSQ